MPPSSTPGPDAAPPSPGCPAPPLCRRNAIAAASLHQSSPNDLHALDAVAGDHLAGLPPLRRRRPRLPPRAPLPSPLQPLVSAIPISLSPHRRCCRSPHELTLTRRRPSPVRGHAPVLSRRGHRPSWLQHVRTARARPRLLPRAPACFGRRPLRTTPPELCPRPRFPGARRHPRLPSLATATTEAPCYPCLPLAGPVPTPATTRGLLLPALLLIAAPRGHLRCLPWPAPWPPTPSRVGPWPLPAVGCP